MSASEEHRTKYGPHTIELDLDGQLYRWSLMFADDQGVIRIRLGRDDLRAALGGAK